MHQMMWYLIVTETLYSVASGRKYCKKLSEDVNNKNYIEIIVFLQKNHIDTNNAYIDQIIKENDDEKKIRAYK